MSKRALPGELEFETVKTVFQSGNNSECYNHSMNCYWNWNKETVKLLQFSQLDYEL